MPPIYLVGRNWGQSKGCFEGLLSSWGIYSISLTFKVYARLGRKNIFKKPYSPFPDGYFYSLSQIVVTLSYGVNEEEWRSQA